MQPNLLQREIPQILKFPRLFLKTRPTPFVHGPQKYFSKSEENEISSSSEKHDNFQNPGSLTTAWCTFAWVVDQWFDQLFRLIRVVDRWLGHVFHLTRNKNMKRPDTPGPNVWATYQPRPLPLTMCCLYAALQSTARLTHYDHKMRLQLSRMFPT